MTAGINPDTSQTSRARLTDLGSCAGSLVSSAFLGSSPSCRLRVDPGIARTDRWDKRVKCRSASLALWLQWRSDARRDHRLWWCHHHHRRQVWGQPGVCAVRREKLCKRKCVSS